jgi:hypothetical protein
MIMISGIVKICILVVIVSLCLTGPVIASAPISTIMQGNAVFVGEEGLDISQAIGADTQIGWWASAADISSSSPTKTIDLKNRMTSFMVSPFEFSGYSGNWYRLNNAGKANGSAFIVADPYLELRIEDTTVNVDVTDKWVPTGDQIGFGIETNLAQIASQRSSSALITIKVQSPNGGEYSSLVNAGGIPVSIVEIPVSTSPYYTNSIWDTGNRALYAPGTYSIWAECNVNRMNDNYDVTGKTISRKISLLNQDQNPLISASVLTTNPTIQMTITPTTKPATAIPSTQTTQKTQQITTATTIITTTPVPTTATLPSTPASSQTKAGGFEATLAGAAIIMGLVLSLKKE